MSDDDDQPRGTASILGSERLYDGFVKLDLYHVEVSQAGRKARVSREVHHHGHGAAVLPVDPARRTALLVRQHRLPVEVSGRDGDSRAGGLLLEACAGLIDPGDGDAATAILREAREELGYGLHDLEEIARVYTCPGVLTEMITCFLARYGPQDRIRGGGGGVDADELIEVEEWSLDDLDAACRHGGIHDAKTLILVQALRLRDPGLFTR